MRLARKGRNPQTGAELNIPETKARCSAQHCEIGATARVSRARSPLTQAAQAPAFTAGKSFKDNVKGR